VLYATATVFGRDNRRASSGGRGHNGPLCGGIIAGTHIEGGVVGGFDITGKNAVSTGINTTDGSTRNPDVAAEDTLNTYYKTVMRLAGVPQELRDVRLPGAKEVLSLG